MITKELLCGVLDLNVTDDGYFVISNDNKYVSIFQDKADFEPDVKINIHELAHKCKEWAYEQEIGKIGTYYNGCGRGQQHLMYEINIVTKYCDKEYLATIDNGKDLNCSLDFFGLSAMHNSSVEQFKYKAQTVKDICFYADTEPGAIFKACQWILDNK